MCVCVCVCVCVYACVYVCMLVHVYVNVVAGDVCVQYVHAILLDFCSSEVL